MNKLCIFILSVLGLSSCNYAELIKPEHRVSKVFYESLDYDLPELSPFKVNGALFVVDVKAINNDEFVIWLGVYSRNKINKLNVEKASISINESSRVIMLNKELPVIRTTETNSLFKNSLKLALIKKGELINNKKIILDVSFKINEEVNRLEFLIENRIEKQQVFPT